MKISICICLFVIVALSSCRDDFETISPEKFNAQLSGNRYIKTPTDLAVVYNNPSAQNEKLSVVSENIDGGRIKITAIYNIYDDDEICGEKYIFTAEHQNGLWKVLDIKYNWRYCDGYGHTDWGTK